MSKSYTSLKSALVIAMTNLKGGEAKKLFETVETVEETNVDGSPTAFVIESTGSGSILSTAQNEREWQFDIHILYGTSGSGKTPEDVSVAMLDAVDRVLEYFDQNPQFEDGNEVAQAKNVLVLPVEFTWATRDVPQSRAILRIGIVDVVNRFN